MPTRNFSRCKRGICLRVQLWLLFEIKILGLPFPGCPPQSFTPYWANATCQALCWAPRMKQGAQQTRPLHGHAIHWWNNHTGKCNKEGVTRKVPLISFLGQGHKSVAEQPGSWAIKVRGRPHLLWVSEKSLHSIQLKESKVPLPTAMLRNQGPVCRSLPLNRSLKLKEHVHGISGVYHNSPGRAVVAASFFRAGKWCPKRWTDFQLAREQCSWQELPQSSSGSKGSAHSTPSVQTAAPSTRPYTSHSVRDQNHTVCLSCTARWSSLASKYWVGLPEGRPCGNKSPSTRQVPGMFQLIFPLHHFPFHFLPFKTEQTAFAFSLIKLF